MKQAYADRIAAYMEKAARESKINTNWITPNGPCEEALKAFVHWLAGQPGYKSRISYSDAEYFNPSANDTRIATARRETPAATVDQIRHALGCMPTDTDIARRNRARPWTGMVTGECGMGSLACA